MDDASFPATKADIALLKTDIVQLRSATRADLEELRTATKTDLEQLRADLMAGVQSLLGQLAQKLAQKHDLQKMYDDLYKADDQILTVLVNMDKRLTGRVEDHETRILQLEGERVGAL